MNIVKDCDPSKIKYIAMHDYHGNVTGLKRRIEGAFKRYGGRKIWLTEVAITKWGQPPSRSTQDAYMSELLPYIAMHDYHGNLTGLKRRIEGAFKRYGGRKIWLTEVAITKWGQPPSRSTQDAYMSELLPYLDSSEHVFRYAWFSSRNS